MNNEMKIIVYSMLEESIDDLMEREGFIRKKNSLLYTKKLVLLGKK